MLWGETQFRQTFNVDREGYIFIVDIGQVFVNGLNLEKLEKKLFKRLSKFFSSLSPNNGKATTFLDVSLGSLRPLRIMVVGEVFQPGAYIISPSATFFTSLYYFKGPTVQGSLRDIRLIRGGKVVSTIDFYDYLLTGKTVNDTRLQLDDVIFIPKRGKTVSIEGETNRQAIFEIKDGENLADLIDMAGGLKNSAYLERAQVDRIVPFEERSENWNDRVVEDFSLKEMIENENSFLLRDGDALKIFSILETHRNDVYISGTSISRPGRYELKPEMKVFDLINAAGGVQSNTYMDKAHVKRIKDDDLQFELISIDLLKAINKEKDHNIKLNWMDELIIYDIAEMSAQYKVLIKGHVLKPGSYFLHKNMTIYDLVFIGGGMLDDEWRKRTFMDRADLARLKDDRINRDIISFDLGQILENPNHENNILLKADDIITIYSNKLFFESNYVTINGEVKNPGTYGLKDNMVLNDLILEAGGLSDGLFNYKVTLARIDPLNDSFDKYVEELIFNGNKIQTISDAKIYADSLKTNEILLEPFDIITIRKAPFFLPQNFVSVTGEVMYPGLYAILSPEENIKSIVDRAGGVKPGAYLEASEFKRDGNVVRISLKDIILKKKSNQDFSVLAGDEIIIRPHKNLVNVVGEVNNPGFQKYISGKNLKYYIKSSGGYNDDANQSNVWVSYPNGNSKKYSRFSLFSPKVIDGSVINVDKLPEEEPFDRTEFMKDLASIFADLVQVITIVAISRQ